MSRIDCLPKNVIKKSCCIKKPLTKPSKVIDVPKNGSCFYHCISYCITGCIEYAEALRSCIDQVIKEDKNCQKLLQSTSSKEEVTQHKKMIESVKGRWATDLDFMATSYLFNLPIYVLTDGKWLKHDLNKTNKNYGLYLVNKNNHYSVVEDVALIEQIDEDIAILEEIVDDDNEVVEKKGETKIIYGSFAQNAVKYPTHSRNSQCMANCAVFLCMCPISFQLIRTDFLDDCLDEGDRVYRETIEMKCHDPNTFLMGEDLNGYIYDIGDEAYKFHCEDDLNFAASGCVTKTYHMYSISLKDGFNKCFASHFSKFLLVICNKCTAIVKNHNSFYFFDPHANADGKSSCRFFENKEQLYRFILELNDIDMHDECNETCYNLIPVSFNKVNGNSTQPSTSRSCESLASKKRKAESSSSNMYYKRSKNIDSSACKSNIQNNSNVATEIVESTIGIQPPKMPETYIGGVNGVKETAIVKNNVIMNEHNKGIDSDKTSSLQESLCLRRSTRSRQPKKLKEVSEKVFCTPKQKYYYEKKKTNKS